MSRPDDAAPAKVTGHGHANALVGYTLAADKT
jgi:hypothetical protein